MPRLSTQLNAATTSIGRFQPLLPYFIFLAFLLVMAPSLCAAQALGTGVPAFGMRHDYAVGLEPYGIATADFNLDGNLDMVTANYIDSISVLIGAGHGIFHSHVDFPTGSSSPFGVATGDFNGDHYPDVVTADNFGGVGNAGVSIFLNQAGVTFQAHQDYSAGLNPTAVAVGDFNHDGKLDLAVADLCDEPEFCSNGTVALLLGNGDGTFGAPAIFPEGTKYGGNPTSIAAGDFNGDHKLDVVLANWEARPGEFTVSVLLGNGDGTFQSSVDYLVGTNPRCAAVGDFNGDGKLDIVSANWYDNTVSVLLGNGDGTFQPQTVFPAGTNPWWVTAGDFNHDGKLDIAVTNNNPNQVNILPGKGDGTFLPPKPLSTGSGPLSIVAADFDRNGSLDVATANYNASSVTVLLNTQR